MIWKTKDGNPFTRLVAQYGRLISSASEEYKSGCEARSLMDGYPLDLRRAEIAKRVKTRGRGDHVAEGAIRAGIEKALMTEWNWRRQLAGMAV